jgi:SAM-dependent methyltransferase
MQYNAYDLKQFYGTKSGRLVRRLLNAHVAQIWPEGLKSMQGQRIAGYGYTHPYLRPFKKSAERIISLIPASQGIHEWSPNDHNLACAVQENEIPLETESVDRLIMVHGLEFSDKPDELLHEMWRVLKSNGRMVLIVPNRLGLWARQDKTPFGHGHPYTLNQLEKRLHNAMFSIEATHKALFMPPFRSFFLLRTAYTLESFGRFFIPGFHGVHMIEVSKQIYAGVPVRAKEKRKNTKRMTVAEPSGF